MGERTKIGQEGFVAMKQAFLEPRHLFAPFFATLKVGFGICDTELRYQATVPSRLQTAERQKIIWAAAYSNYWGMLLQNSSRWLLKIAGRKV